MAASGVGQFSINVKSNLKDFYGELTKAQKSMKDLTEKRYQLNIDSKQLDQLRDKSQRIAAEMRELRQQKNEIKIGSKQVENAEQEIENINKKLVSLNRQKLEVDAEIQPIRTANTELYKVEQEIDRINNTKVDIKFSDSIKNVGNSMTKMGDGILNKFNPLTSKLNQMFGFGLINKGINSATGMITGSVSSAIKRIDTLNNFTKVMSNMNISQQEAEKSREKLDKGLDGLPTTIDNAVSAVQRFTSSNQDISKSTDMFLALNNAILAGAQSDEIQSSALEQISQAYSKGKPDMMEWRSMLTAMPAQITQIAEAFGMSQDELGEALRGGEISMDDFMSKIIEMNTTSTNGFKSFEEQAKNATDGVETNISLMKSAVRRGVADIIITIDEVLKETGLGGISGSLKKVGDTFEKSLKSFSKLLIKNKGEISKFFEFIKSGINEFTSIVTKFDFSSFFSGLAKGLQGLAKDAKNLINTFKPLTTLLGKLFGNGNFAEGLGKFLPRLLELGIALKVIGTATKGLGAVSGILGKFGKFKLPSFGKSSGGGSLPLKNIGVNDFKELGLKLAAVAGISANIYLAAKALQEVNEINGDFGSLQTKIGQIALAITEIAVLTVAVEKVNKLTGSSPLAGFVAIAAISGELFLMAKALQQVDEISSDFGGVQAKIGQIALAVVEMGALSIAVGLIMDTGIGAVALASGLVAILAITGTLFLVAKGFEEIAKANIDQEKIKTNLDAINSSMESLGALGQGSLSGVVDKLGGLLENFISIGIIAEINIIAKQLKELENVELNKEKITSAISTINSIVSETTSGSLVSSLKSFFKGGIKAEELDKARQTFDEMVKIADSLKMLEGINLNQEAIIGADGSGGTIGIIKKAIESISNFATDEIASNLQGIAAALAKIMGILNENYPPKFAELGKILANKMNDGFKANLNFQKIVQEKLKAITTDKGKAIGKTLANNLNTGFSETINLGKAVSDSIEEALAKDYSTTVTVHTNTDNGSSSTKKASSNTSKSNKITPAFKLPNTIMASGGRVVTDSVLQDSPEKPLLNNGEYVIPKKIVDALGVPFFDKLRSGSISRTFAGLAQSVSNTTSSVVNNVYNTTNNQSTNVYSSGKRDWKSRANRRFRTV